jgi:hypothetical protein
MKRLVKVVLLSCAVLAILAVIGVVRAHAAEGTLTEVVESVKAVQAEVAAEKAELSAVKTAIEAVDPSQQAWFSAHPLQVEVGGALPAFAATPSVDVANWEGAPSGGTVELASKSEVKLAEGNKESAVFTVGAICGLFLCLVFWVMIRPRNS